MRVALDWKTAYAEMHAKGEADFPPACLHYLLQLNRMAFRNQSGRALTPAELVEAFRKQTRRDFGPLQGKVCEDWGMRGPADLGRAILLMGRYGCLSLDSSDTVESFAMDARPFGA
jgi:uncharacterized repeat protein (TIGR04138 family)